MPLSIGFKVAMSKFQRARMSKARSFFGFKSRAFSASELTNLEYSIFVLLSTKSVIFPYAIERQTCASELSGAARTAFFAYSRHRFANRNFSDRFFTVSILSE